MKRALLIPVAAGLLGALGPLALAQEPSEASWHVVAEEIALADLLEVCARELGVAIDYAPDAIEGSVVIRSGPGVSIEGLWATTNRLLADQGLACVQVPGEDSLGIVKLEQAAGLARLETEPIEGARAGYVKTLREVHAKDPSTLTSALAELLPKDGTLVTALSGKTHVLLAGLKPNVMEALEVLALLDKAPSRVVVEEIEMKHLSPTALAALLEQITQKRKAVDQKGLSGGVLADPGSNTLLIVAPEDEVAEWEDLVRRFDRAEILFTKNYVPRRFGVAETAQLITQVVAPGGRATSRARPSLRRAGLVGRESS